MAFWSRWYFPANAVLYVVGDFDRSVDEVRGLIDACFGGIPPAREPLPGAGQPALLNGSSSSSGNWHGDELQNGRGGLHSGGAASTSGGSNGNGAAPAADAAGLAPLKRKHAVRPSLSRALSSSTAVAAVALLVVRACSHVPVAEWWPVCGMPLCLSKETSGTSV